ncbi:hypothetical protein BGZ80_009879 [Entomortierella chlamydospora]|uniref:AAA+ ATPase domain-containing protein n=1 Tax=Entomortierella chlamydospora TaxID=101097 RepID=A0A9P6MW77_9FUNG|nr:hypothetical protein BGZ80_009879 [Entomortierella chlamydospora]
MAVEGIIGDNPINSHEPPLSEHSLKRKASHSFPTGRETPTKSAKHIAKHIPDNQAASTSGSSPMLLSFKDVQAALQAYYEPYLNIRRVSGDTLGLESCYINLAIVEAPNQRQKDKEDLKAQSASFHRMPSYEKISMTNMEEPIPSEQLFDKRKLRDGRDVPKAILVQGRAGIGKTTLCKKLLKGFRARNIEDLLREKYFAQCPEQEREAFVSLLAARARNSRILFILDGLDEILTDTQTAGGVALEAFLKHLLRQEYVVITSRPSGVDNSILPKLDLELETIGFSKQNVNDYLSNILKPEDARAVEDFIKRTPSIQSLVNIPVQLDVICYSWDLLPSNEQSITMTGLYQTIVRRLWSKDAERLQKEVGTSLTSQRIQRLPQYQIDRLVAIESEYLSFLAFKGMGEGKIEFDESTLLNAMEELDELRETVNQEPLPLQLLDTLKQTSFLHTADAELDANKDDSQRAWYFLHLTFQEYFAATWIVRHLQIKPKVGSSFMTLEEIRAYIQKHKYNPRYQIVWWMVAGMLYGEALTSFFRLLQGAPMDLIGGYHHHLLAGCLNEATGQLDDKSVENVGMQLRQWLQLEMMANASSYGRSILGGMSYFPEEILIRSIGQSGASRNYLVRTLAMRASLTQSAIGVLINALQDVQDQDRRLRRTIANALGKQSTLSEPTLQALVGALHHKSWDVRRSAVETLGNQLTLPGSTLQALVGALQDNDRGGRESAACVLGKQSALPESILQALTSALQDWNWDVRKSAVEAIGKQSTLPESTLQALAGALQDWSRDVRKSVAEALGNQSALPESILQALIGAIQDSDREIRRLAAKALGNQSTLPKSTLQALVGALQHENEDVRISAALALSEQSTLPESTLQALVSALHHKSRHVRRLAAEALGNQSTLSESTLQALVGALQDDDRGVRESAVEALGKQSTLPESILQALVGSLQYENEDVRISAALALSEQSTLPESTLQALIGALHDKGLHASISAVEVLEKQSTLPVSVIQSLVRALNVNNEYFRERVVTLLEQHARSTFMAIPSLSSSAIRKLHKAFLINYCSLYSTSLWFQGHQVFFYTVQGLEEIEICAEDITKVTNAFDLVRKRASPL